MEHKAALTGTDGTTDCKETYTCSRPLEDGSGKPEEKLAGEGISLGSVLSQRTQATLHQLVSHVLQGEPCLVTVLPHTRSGLHRRKGSLPKPDLPESLP